MNAILIPNVYTKALYCVLADITLIHTISLTWGLLLFLLYYFPTVREIETHKGLVTCSRSYSFLIKHLSVRKYGKLSWFLFCYVLF